MLTIRKAKPSDLLPLLQLAEKYHHASEAWQFYGELDGEWIASAIGLSIMDTRTNIMVAIKDGNLIGVHWSTLVVQLMAPVDLLSTNFFFVLPDHRSYQVAHGLLLGAEEFAREKGAKGIVAGCNFSDDPNTNRAAEVLHKRSGYTSFGTTHFKYV